MRRVGWLAYLANIEAGKRLQWIKNWWICQRRRFYSLYSILQANEHITSPTWPKHSPSFHQLPGGGVECEKSTHPPCCWDGEGKNWPGVHLTWQWTNNTFFSLHSRRRVPEVPPPPSSPTPPGRLARTRPQAPPPCSWPPTTLSPCPPYSPRRPPYWGNFLSLFLVKIIPRDVLAEDEQGQWRCDRIIFPRLWLKEILYAVNIGMEQFGFLLYLLYRVGIFNTDSRDCRRHSNSCTLLG